MHEKQPTKALKVSIEKRVLNEFGSKILNEERLDHVMRSREDERGYVPRLIPRCRFIVNVMTRTAKK